mgnify:CR=1 FL=1
MGRIFNKEVFSKRLSELMIANGDTTYSLAEYLHLSPPTISRYATGEMAPKITTIEAIAKKYGVNHLWLMGTEGAEKYLDTEPTIKKIPILGTIAAGQPIFVEENIEGYEYVVDNFKVDFCLRVKGDSMVNARINDGDIVFVRQQSDVENGEIAVVITDGCEATLKRVYKYPGTVILRPENPKYEEIVFTKKSFKEVKIIGKCIAVKFNIERGA